MYNNIKQSNSKNNIDYNINNDSNMRVTVNIRLLTKMFTYQYFLSDYGNHLCDIITSLKVTCRNYLNEQYRQNRLEGAMCVQQ